ncbi:MAG: DNA polymerase III subunit gamma/tau [Spirochaetia bacterium]|nr:DNA polymerase III subunit gamma/tau [Spirochaetia bacterium]
MAYEVTATRRRPQQFEDLAGQEFVAETLKNSIKTKQFAHAYLFAGPRGCGKTSTARILAKSLNCQAGGDPTCTPCGQCESCKSITNSSSMDVIEIDGASNTSVNDVRQIKDEVMFPPTSCRYKIYIIDEVHMLSTSAFNALLKTIEEPPAHVIFIFATTELQKVPATIKSRCQQYNFRLVASDRLKELLSDACREMNIQADDEALYWIAKESGGSVRDCYTLFDQVAAFSDGHITYDKIRDKLGLLGVDRLNSIFENCVSGNAEVVMNELDSFLQSGISIEQLISNSTEYLRSLLLIKNGIKKESLLGQSPERYSGAVLNGWNTIQTERGISIFLQLYRDIRYSLSPRYELELAFSRLCWLSQYVSPSEVKAAIDKAQALLCGGAQGAALSQGAAGSQGAALSQGAMGSQGAVASQGAALSQGAIGSQGAASSQSASSSQGAVASQDTRVAFGTFSSPAPEKTISSEKTDATNNWTQVENTSGNAPNGMHMFSALMNAKQNNESKGENQTPFHNGGAVPPEQTAAENISYDDLENPDDGNYAPVDDDWSATGYPENDEYLADSYAEDEENQQNDLPSSEDIHASSENFVNSKGESINLKTIYDQLILKLSKENAMTGSALMQTASWKLNRNCISTEIDSDFQFNKIKENLQLINGIISDICGETVTFEIKKKEIKTEQSNVEVPAQIKMLCSIFKGTIVGGKH